MHNSIVTEQPNQLQDIFTLLPLEALYLVEPPFFTRLPIINSLVSNITVYRLFYPFHSFPTLFFSYFAMHYQFHIWCIVLKVEF